jgi:hypothetical protein
MFILLYNQLSSSRLVLIYIYKKGHQERGVVFRVHGRLVSLSHFIGFIYHRVLFYICVGDILDWVEKVPRM